MKIKIFGNINELAHFFAGLIIDGLAKTDEDDFFSMALSGGSTPKDVFRVLALDYKERINWKKIRIFWDDERCVDPDNEESNYKMARTYLLDHVPIPETNIFRIMGEEDPDKESIRYEGLIREKVKIKKGIPQFDLVMLGLGEDGHTASLFPDSLHLMNSKKLFEATQNPYNQQNRITATGKLLNHAKLIIFLVTGSSKAKILSDIINHRKEATLLPSFHIKPYEGELYWLVDEQAAAKLDEK